MESNRALQSVDRNDENFFQQKDTPMIREEVSLKHNAFSRYISVLRFLFVSQGGVRGERYKKPEKDLLLEISIVACPWTYLVE
jgi:hypothetical protein